MIRTFDYFLEMKIQPMNYLTPIVLSDSDTNIVTELCNKIDANDEFDKTLSGDVYYQAYCALSKKGKSYHEHATKYLKFSAQCENLHAITKMFNNRKQTFSETDEYKKLLTINSGESNNLIGCILFHEKKV